MHVRPSRTVPAGLLLIRLTVQDSSRYCATAQTHAAVRGTESQNTALEQAESRGTCKLRHGLPAGRGDATPREESPAARPPASGLTEAPPPLLPLFARSAVTGAVSLPLGRLAAFALGARVVFFAAPPAAVAVAATAAAAGAAEAEAEAEAGVLPLTGFLLASFGLSHWVVFWFQAKGHSGEEKRKQLLVSEKARGCAARRTRLERLFSRLVCW